MPKPKFYALLEFPYPSGFGLHIGHTRPYTAMDIVARKRRMQDFDVLFPFGWDAFGLPTENFAIEHHMHPRDVTHQNIAHFRQQVDALQYSFDWQRELNTTDPEFYRWTQWIFLEMFKRGLAYKSKMPVNWCTNCKCVLANEEVIDGTCERCGSEVVRREKSQWMLKITAYADRLIDDLAEVNYPEHVKTQQINWIGRSTGAELDFPIADSSEKIRVFTTRPDTLFGATYLVIAPEHAAVDALAQRISNHHEVVRYREAASRKSDFERGELAKEKTGVKLEGIRAINPVNGASIPIYIADYVLSTYGTGAIMAVPGHDDRDWDFAKKYGLPIVEVVSGALKCDVQDAAYTGDGVAVNSDFLNGLNVNDAKRTMIEWLESRGIGAAKVNFKLRDWVFSRQRYWGEPIPVVHCEHCGFVPLDESQLPLLLPDVESYETTDTGESPLSTIDKWVDVPCPKCNRPAKRETDTMPQWAGSSWYYLRYMSPQCDFAPVDPTAISHWGQVDWYNGGMEHTTLHLLYSRFWHKFLFDIGVVPHKEPYAKRTSHGYILGADGVKMSKSRGNIVTPEEVIEQFGSDTLRLYIMFIGDFEQVAVWNPQAVKGCRRFLDRFLSLSEKPTLKSSVCEPLLHRTIKKVGDDIELLKFNTAIASMMSLLNELSDKGASREDLRTFSLVLSPFAPTTSQLVWSRLGEPGEAASQPWPLFDESKLIDSSKTLAVQVNGKLRSTIVMPTGASNSDVVESALADPHIAKIAVGKTLAKSIVVPDKLVNLIFK
jgi:leucyl-tRNA synthetase